MRSMTTRRKYPNRYVYSVREAQFISKERSERLVKRFRERTNLVTNSIGRININVPANYHKKQFRLMTTNLRNISRLRSIRLLRH